LFYNKFILCLYMFRALCAHHQEAKIVLYSIWYRHTETREWSNIIKIQVYKYEHIVVKFMYEFFGYDYCILRIIITLCHVQVTFILLWNVLKTHYVYLYYIYILFYILYTYKILNHSLVSVWRYQMLYNTILTAWWWAHSARNM